MRAEVIRNQNIIKTSAKTVTLGDIGSIAKVKSDSNDIFIKNWGSSNDAPTQREKLLRESGMPATLISTKSNMTTGVGELYCYIENYETIGNKTNVTQHPIAMPDEIKSFYNLSGRKKYFRLAANELHIHANIFTEFIPSIGGQNAKNPFTKVKLQPCRYIRAEQMNEEGIVENWFWRGDAWQKRSDEKKNKFLPKRIAAYNENWLIDGVVPSENFIFHSGNELFSDEYYFIPIIDGVAADMDLFKQIMTMYDTIVNTTVIDGNHAEILDQILDDGTEDDGTPEYATAKKVSEDAKFTEIRDAIVAQYTGKDNAGRTLITEYHIEDGKEVSHVKIKPIPTNFQSESFLKLLDRLISTIISAFQIHPTLANVESQGKLSSGSEMRNAYLAWIAIHASSYREILLEVYYLASIINKWDPKIKFGFRDAVITTLSENQTGSQTKNITSGGD